MSKKPTTPQHTAPQNTKKDAVADLRVGKTLPVAQAKANARKPGQEELQAQIAEQVAQQDEQLPEQAAVEQQGGMQLAQAAAEGAATATDAAAGGSAEQGLVGPLAGAFNPLLALAGVGVVAGASGGGGGGGAAAPAPAAVVNKGLAVDGYIEGGQIFVQAENGTRTLVGRTGDKGQFIGLDNTPGLKLTEAQSKLVLVLTGGTDTGDGDQDLGANTLTLTAPPGSSVISPLTTLVVALKEKNGDISFEQAEKQIKQAFGIPDSTDLNTLDPVTGEIIGSEDGSVSAAVALEALQAGAAVNQILFAVLGATANSGVDQEDIIASVLDAIEDAGGELSPAALALAAVGDLDLNDLAKIALQKAIADDLKAIEDATSVDGTFTAQQDAENSPTPVVTIGEAEPAGELVFGETTIDVEGGLLTVTSGEDIQTFAYLNTVETDDVDVNEPEVNVNLRSGVEPMVAITTGDVTVTSEQPREILVHGKDTFVVDSEDPIDAEQIGLSSLASTVFAPGFIGGVDVAGGALTFNTSLDYPSLTRVSEGANSATINLNADGSTSYSNVEALAKDVTVNVVGDSSDSATLVLGGGATVALSSNNGGQQSTRSLDAADTVTVNFELSEGSSSAASEIAADTVQFNLANTTLSNLVVHGGRTVFTDSNEFKQAVALPQIVAPIIVAPPGPGVVDTPTTPVAQPISTYALQTVDTLAASSVTASPGDAEVTNLFFGVSVSADTVAFENATNFYSSSSDFGGIDGGNSRSISNSQTGEVTYDVVSGEDFFTRFSSSDEYRLSRAAADEVTISLADVADAQIVAVTSNFTLNQDVIEDTNGGYASVSVNGGVEVEYSRTSSTPGNGVPNTFAYQAARTTEAADRVDINTNGAVQVMALTPQEGSIRDFAAVVLNPGIAANNVSLAANSVQLNMISGATQYGEDSQSMNSKEAYSGQSEASIVVEGAESVSITAESLSISNDWRAPSAGLIVADTINLNAGSIQPVNLAGGIEYSNIGSYSGSYLDGTSENKDSTTTVTTAASEVNVVLGLAGGSSSLTVVADKLSVVNTTAARVQATELVIDAPATVFNSFTFEANGGFEATLTNESSNTRTPTTYTGNVSVPDGFTTTFVQVTSGGNTSSSVSIQAASEVSVEVQGNINVNQNSEFFSSAVKSRFELPGIVAKDVTLSSDGIYLENGISGAVTVSESSGNSSFTTNVIFTDSNGNVTNPNGNIVQQGFSNSSSAELHITAADSVVLTAEFSVEGPGRSGFIHADSLEVTASYISSLQVGGDLNGEQNLSRSFSTQAGNTSSSTQDFTIEGSSNVELRAEVENNGEYGTVSEVIVYGGSDSTDVVTVSAYGIYDLSIQGETRFSSGEGESYEKAANRVEVSTVIEDESFSSNDNVTIMAKSGFVNLGNGNDYIELRDSVTEAQALSVDLGSGDDTLAFDDYSRDDFTVTFDAASGALTFTAVNTEARDIYTVKGAEVVAFSDGNYNVVNGTLQLQSQVIELIALQNDVV